MSTVKISALPEKLTLEGTEELFVNDSGTSRKLSASLFTAIQSASEAAQAAAETAQTGAETAETNAAASVTSASNAATAAAGYSATATAQAALATASASDATAAASSASSSASSAASAQSAAESARDSALAAYDSFDDRYLGAKSSAPTLDNDGDALVVGALYFDTTTDTMKVYSSGGWTAAGSSVNGTANRYDYVVGTSSGGYTGSTTNFPAIYDAGFVDVFLNGVKLIPTTDFTATSGTEVVLTSAASSGDALCIIGYGTFNIASFSIGDASDVEVAGASDGDVLLYNSSTSSFEVGGVFPDQTGNSGKYLTTDGTDTSWATVDALPDQTDNSGKYLTTDGTDASWVSLSSNSLTQSFPLASGGSITAGKAVSINSSSEVGEYPVGNSIGTAYNPSNTTAFVTTNTTTALSTDGSRAIYVNLPNTGDTSSTATITGYAVNTSGTPVIGGTTASLTLTYSSQGNNSWEVRNWQVHPINATTFAVTAYVKRNLASAFGYGIYSVDSSGNVSTVTSSQLWTNSISDQSFDEQFRQIAFFDKDQNIAKVAWDVYHVSGYSTARSGVITFTSSSASNVSDSSVRTGYSISKSGIRNSETLTTNNISVHYSKSNDTINIQTATVSGGLFSSWASNTSLITDATTSGNFYMSFPTNNLAIAIYKNTLNQDILKTYSVNQTTGALTFVDSKVLTEDASSVSISVKETDAKDEQSIVYTYEYNGVLYINSIDLDGSYNILGVNSPISLGTGSASFISYTGTPDIYNTIYYQDSVTKSIAYTVNAYSTVPFIYAGLAAETASSGTASVTINGVNSNVSGLTVGSLYYVSTANDGSITTNNTSGILIGKAISSTEIALGIGA